MTSKLREALEVNEFKQRYILRRMLCESYIKKEWGYRAIIII